jgi:hypothetical protein
MNKYLFLILILAIFSGCGKNEDAVKITIIDSSGGTTEEIIGGEK